MADDTAFIDSEAMYDAPPQASRLPSFRSRSTTVSRSTGFLSASRVAQAPKINFRPVVYTRLFKRQPDIQPRMIPFPLTDEITVADKSPVSSAKTCFVGFKIFFPGFVVTFLPARFKGGG